MAERRGLIQNCQFPRITSSFREIPAAGGDPDFASVVLLLDFDGVDGATNITDLSNSGHVDTFLENAEVDTAQQFLGKNMLLLDGVGADRVIFPDSADWTIGTGDFTFECGVRFTGVSTTSGFLSSFLNPDGIGFRWVVGDTTLQLIGLGIVQKSEVWVPVIDTTYHVACSRNGTDLRFFIDGVELGTTSTNSANFNTSGAVFGVGATGVGSVEPHNGHIGAVRVTKGVGRYTENFTPLTEFYPTPAVTTDPDFASVVLLLDFAGVDAGTNITDLSSSAHVDTFNSTAEIDTAIQALGENTLLFPATGTPNVSFSDSADWDFGTGDFTLECSFQTSEDARSGVLLSTYDAPDGWALQHLAGANLRFIHGDTVLKTEAWNPDEDTMHHVAVTREGTNLRIFVDGVQLGSPTTDSTSFTGSTNGCVVGALLAAGTLNVRGSIGAVRITKGVARYTANFTPPTEFYPTS